MGMSMHCLAVKPADDNYCRKAAAYHACESARIPIPRELVDFFEGGEPDPTGTTTSLDDRKHESCAAFERDAQQGFEVDITKLPPGTRFVRFYCSW